MATQTHDDDPALARQKLIELLEDEDGRRVTWKFTRSAQDQGRNALKAHFGAFPSDEVMIEYFAHLLRSDFPIHRTPLGEPPGSGGIGWVMNNPDGNQTYIKLKIEQDGVYDIALVLSCHTSKHKPA